jgi:hypothetical protein
LQEKYCPFGSQEEFIAQNVLSIIDTDSNGIVTRDEHTAAYLQNNPSASEEEIEIDFTWADSTIDDQIELGEICQILDDIN